MKNLFYDLPEDILQKIYKINFSDDVLYWLLVEADLALYQIENEQENEYYTWNGDRGSTDTDTDTDTYSD